MRDQRRKRRIGVLVFALLIFNPILLGFGIEGIIHISLSLATMGILTFISLLMLPYFLFNDIAPRDMRRAIAGAFTLVYISLLAVISFSDVGASEDRMKWIVENFTTIFGIVIAFYFGTKIAEDVGTAIAERRKEEEKKENSQ